METKTENLIQQLTELPPDQIAAVLWALDVRAHTVVTNFVRSRVKILGEDVGNERLKELGIDPKNFSEESRRIVQLLGIVLETQERAEGLVTTLTRQVESLQQDLLKKDEDLRKKEAESRIDGLTGLANLNGMKDQLMLTLSEMLRMGSGSALFCYMDLDKFGSVNKRYSHDHGDVLLQTIGKGLKAELRDTDISARKSGDEFMVLTRDPRRLTVEHALAFGSSIRKALWSKIWEEELLRNVDWLPRGSQGMIIVDHAWVHDKYEMFRENGTDKATAIENIMRSLVAMADKVLIEVSKVHRGTMTVIDLSTQAWKSSSPEWDVTDLASDHSIFPVLQHTADTYVKRPVTDAPRE